MARARPRGEAGFRPDGGCGFPVDPALEAPQADCLWRPEIAPAVVVQLAPAPQAGRYLAGVAELATALRIADGGAHVRLRNGLQLLLLSGATLADPLAAVLPLDDDFPVRVAAAEALFDVMAGGRAPRDPLSRQRRDRLKRMLRALDGRAGAASYRDLAEQLFGDVPGDSAAWRTSTVRDVVIRLSRGAVQLMRGGYRALLRKRR